MADISYQTFTEFLQRNDCEDAFNQAFFEQNGYTRMDERLWNILDPDECFLNQSLNWSKTAQGREFWKAIDEKWYKEHEPK